jgi:uncharacterized protein with PQ loop repeat
MEQWIGWAAVGALFVTMTGQAWKQWRDRVKHGISKFFFLGQVTASVLFLAYSILMGDRIFIVGNALVLAAAIAGGAILAYNRRRA